MTWIIVGIVIIVVLAGGVWGLQQYNNRRVKQLDVEVEKLDNGELASLVRSIANLGLAGDSLKQFTKSQRDYQRVIETDLAGLQTALLDVELQNKQFQFVKVQETITAIQGHVVETAQKLTKIRSALVALRDSEADTRSQLTTLRGDYQAARKTILAKSYAFDAALPGLEQSLQTLAEAMHDAAVTSESGDHAAASVQLQQLAIGVGTLQDQVKRLPSLVNTVVNEFPGQLEELQTGYHELAAQHYQFTQDVPAGIEAVQGNVKQAQVQIKDLAVDDLASNVADTASAIDELYATMEKELKAKQAVLQQQGDLKQFLAHAQKQNHALLLELDHLDQSYTLTHGEQATAASLKTQLAGIAKGFNDTQQAMQNETAVYSQILAQYQQARQDLHDIEVQHQKINHDVSGLQAREQKAVASAQQFEMALRDIKYEVSRHSLPGLPRPYLDFFNVVTKELAQLNHDLNQVKIDLDQIAKQLIKLSEDIDQLKDQSRTVVDAAGMCEQLLQYANRYKTSHPEVDQAVVQAKDLYQHYNYAQAADLIAAALEKVEPGAYQKVEDDYLASKSASLF
ncbi:septation ring formation regulator EzrA [Lacticaseibacillus baoqingensis]|uniref:Septation ring formation regulator EzrA n=1 Tax=Lacticaseibacillus baoqingensis TaxID=2486013 RepID=A0ABW4E4I2_9LACO|nr:septation ring formation regulator EzrA [Lacticaseibacillus baoqingensis]